MLTIYQLIYKYHTRICALGHEHTLLSPSEVNAVGLPSYGGWGSILLGMSIYTLLSLLGVNALGLYGDWF